LSWYPGKLISSLLGHHSPLENVAYILGGAISDFAGAIKAKDKEKVEFWYDQVVFWLDFFESTAKQLGKDIDFLGEKYKVRIARDYAREGKWDNALDVVSEVDESVGHKLLAL